MYVKMQHVNLLNFIFLIIFELKDFIYKNIGFPEANFIFKLNLIWVHVEHMGM